MGIIIRKTVSEALSEIDIKTILFTTFSFHPEFFENNVLPIVFNIDNDNRTARKNLVNQKLSYIPCAVFYDKSTTPSGGGNYLYQAVGIQLVNRFFHPKNIFVFGYRNNSPVIFVSAASANLTKTAWGNQEEVFSFIFIENKNEQSKELSKFLNYLKTKFCQNIDIPAIDAALSFIALLKKGKDNPESLYFSSTSTTSFYSLLNDNATRRWKDVHVFSPYWGENIFGLLDKFSARNFYLYPAIIKEKGNCIGISDTALEVLNSKSVVFKTKRNNYADGRFSHAKFYVIQGRPNSVDLTRIGVGSCNFTENGLSGKKGNVESMIIFKSSSNDVAELLDQYKSVSFTSTDCTEFSVDEIPHTLPFDITVVLDWSKKCYFITYHWLLTSRPPSSCRISLPGVENLFLFEKSVYNNLRLFFDKPPTSGKSFELKYSFDENEFVSTKGLIIEVNLINSEKHYFPHLTSNDFFSSWRNPESYLIDIAGALDKPDNPNVDDLQQQLNTDSPIEDAIKSDKDFFDIYAAYRGFFDLYKRLYSDIGLLRDYLITRPDSIYRLISSIDSEIAYSYIEKFSIICECKFLLEHFRKDINFPIKDLKTILNIHYKKYRGLIYPEIENDPYRKDISVDETINWLENQIRKAWNYEQFIQ